MLYNLVLSVLGIILTILIVIGVHEGAHFGVARLLGIKVLRCSIGFGKALYRWHDKKGTEYILAPIPLGGYVKLLDENEGEVPESEKYLAFNRQPLYKRVATVAAGPLSNLLMAILLYWVIFIIGFNTIIPIIGKIEPHSIASKAGLKPQQEIVSVDGHLTRGWSSVTLRMIVHVGNQDSLTLDTKNQNKAFVQSHILNLEDWQMNALKPDPLSSLGITPYMPEIPMIIGEIESHSPAASSSLTVGDEIVSIDNKRVISWDDFLDFIEKNPDRDITLGIKHDNTLFSVPILIGHQRNLIFHKYGFLGVAPHLVIPPHLLRTIQYGPVTALYYAAQEALELSYLNLLLFGKLVTNKLSMLSLGGPITIFESASSALALGVIPFLSFLAFLNVAIGIINIFPIPGLDGGHLFFQFIELIMRRPVSMRMQLLFYRLGFIFLIIILVQALTNDLLRLWS